MFFKNRVSRSLVFLKQGGFKNYHREIKVFKPFLESVPSYSNFYMSKTLIKNKPLFFSKFWLFNYSGYIIFFIFFYRPKLKERKRKFKFFKFDKDRKTKRASFLSNIFVKFRRRKRNKLARRLRYKVKKRVYRLNFSRLYKTTVVRNFKYCRRYAPAQKRRFLKNISTGIWSKKHYKYFRYRFSRRYAFRKTLKFTKFKSTSKLFKRLLPIKDFYKSKVIYTLFKPKLKKYRSKKRLRIRHYFNNTLYARL